MYRMAKALLVVAVFALVLTPLATAEQGQITIPSNGRATVLTLALKQSDTVSYSWSSNGSVTFRIDNAAGSTLVDITGQTGSGNWQVPADDSYTFEFRNPGDPASVTVNWTINHSSPILSVTMVYALVAVAIAVAAAATLMVHSKKPKDSQRS